jgi:hypothetical protein
MTSSSTASESLPLSTLLSFAWVAFTIEVDNMFEARMPHRTTIGGSKGGGGPWLVSHAMWWNCMRYVDETGLSVTGLETLARTATNLNGMIRWGYVTQTPAAASAAQTTRRAAPILTATAKGLKARNVWRTLPDEVEARWRQRAGEAEIVELRESLAAIIPFFSTALPDCLPILGYGLKSSPVMQTSCGEAGRPADLPLQASLARTLLAFTLEYEETTGHSLAIGANVLRLLENPTPVRALPQISGVSKEAIEVAIGLLEKQEMASITTQQRVRMLALTPRGLKERQVYEDAICAIETRWRSQYGERVVTRLRKALEQIVSGPEGKRFLAAAVAVPPGGWRALVKPADTLPWQPMVLHRGGYPDGS